MNSLEVSTTKSFVVKKTVR